MYVKLDEQVEALLCCAACNGELKKRADGFACEQCGMFFARRIVQLGSNRFDYVYDFRIHRPAYCLPQGHRQWSEAQVEFERYHGRSVSRDSLDEYLAEIDGVREIYTEEFHLRGKILDVGGHQGRLRHFLGEEARLFVSVDPFIDIFSDLDRQPNLLRAFPCLAQPCNFLAAHAEHLPFKSESFDWVHMRSVVDHFADPYLAFREAFRCCKRPGQLLVGLSIAERKLALDEARREQQFRRRIARALRLDTLKHIGERLGGGYQDDHMFRLTQSDLIDLFQKSGWQVVKQLWQKPPYEFCSYTCGQTRIPVVAAA